MPEANTNSTTSLPIGDIDFSFEEEDFESSSSPSEADDENKPSTSSTEGVSENQEEKEEGLEESEETIETEEGTLTQDIYRALGLEGQPEEDSIDTILYGVGEASRRMAEEQLNATFASHPELKLFKDYLDAGGEPNNFFKERFPDFDYTSFSLKEDDESSQMRIVKDGLKQSGFADSDIDAMIKTYSNNGILYQQAQSYLKVLSAKQQEQRDTMLEKQKERQQKEIEEAEQVWETVKNTINSKNDFKGIPLPVTKKQAFIDYLEKPVKDGRTQRDIDYGELKMEDHLLIDWLIFNKFNISTFVKNVATTEKAKSLKDRLSSKSTTRSSPTTKQQSDFVEALERGNIDFSA